MALERKRLALIWSEANSQSYWRSEDQARLSQTKPDAIDLSVTGHCADTRREFLPRPADRQAASRRSRATIPGAAGASGNTARRDTSRVRGNGRVRRAVRIARDLCVAATPADACPRWNRPTSRRRVHACQARPATRRGAISTL